MASLSPEEKKEEEIKTGATSALPKITQAGYSSLDVSSSLFQVSASGSDQPFNSLFGTLPVVQMRSARGQSEREPKPHKLLESYSMPSFFFNFFQSFYTTVTL